MAVLAIKTEPKCKLCQHPERAAIDALIEQRANREKDADGNQINLEYVLARLIEWGVVNPNEDNIKIHWRRHCQRQTDQAVVAAIDAQLGAAQKLLEGGEHADVDDTLRTILTLGRADLEARVARGERVITVDHMLKAVAELTRRDHNQAQQDLLGALTMGIGAALGPAKPVKELAGAEVVEVEAVEELAA